MARYINEDEFVAWVKEHWCADCQNDNGLRCRACWIDDAIDIVEEAPEADVVPKSEVEELKKAYLQYEEVSGLKQVKREVAMEIFKEIEREFCGAHWYKGYTIERYIAELKKKYTEENKDEKGV